MLPPAPIPDRLTASGFIGMIAMATSLAAPRADAALALLTVGADAACDFRSDLSAGARPVDAPITHLAGPFDVGAFEWSFDLFRDGFED